MVYIVLNNRNYRTLHETDNHRVARKNLEEDRRRLL